MSERLYRKVTYVMRGPAFGLAAGWVIMGFGGEASALTAMQAQDDGRVKTLKCWWQFFDAIRRGEKTFEIRLDDRTPRYEVGDVLELVRQPVPGNPA